MRSEFLRDIYLEYFVTLRASWLYFGTDTSQPSQSCIVLVIFVRYASPASAENGSCQNGVVSV